jgi:hypothetical protein
MLKHNVQFSMLNRMFCVFSLFVALHPPVVYVLGELHERERGGCFIDGKSKGKEKFQIVVNARCTQMSAEHACTPTQTHVSKTF